MGFAFLEFNSWAGCRKLDQPAENSGFVTFSHSEGARFLRTIAQNLRRCAVPESERVASEDNLFDDFMDKERSLNVQCKF